jgi:hypothetical protein
MKIEEIKSTTILFTIWVFYFTAQFITNHCYHILFKLLINFNARFRYNHKSNNTGPKNI